MILQQSHHRCFNYLVLSSSAGNDSTTVAPSPFTELHLIHLADLAEKHLNWWINQVNSAWKLKAVEPVVAVIVQPWIKMFPSQFQWSWLFCVSILKFWPSFLQSWPQALFKIFQHWKVVQQEKQAFTNYFSNFIKQQKSWKTKQIIPFLLELSKNTMKPTGYSWNWDHNVNSNIPLMICPVAIWQMYSYQT